MIESQGHCHYYVILEFAKTKCGYCLPKKHSIIFMTYFSYIEHVGNSHQFKISKYTTILKMLEGKVGITFVTNVKFLKKTNIMHA